MAVGVVSRATGVAAGGWEDSALDTLTDARAEATAARLGLKGVIAVEGDALPPTPVLATHLQTAFKRSMSRALGPDGSDLDALAFQMRVRPGGGASGLSRASAGLPFRFSMLPGQADTRILQEHLASEVQHSGQVCLLPELRAVFEENAFPRSIVTHLLLSTEEDASVPSPRSSVIRGADPSIGLKDTTTSLREVASGGLRTAGSEEDSAIHSGFPALCMLTPPADS